MTPAKMAEDAGISRELLHAYGSASRPKLPPADALRAVADYLDARIARLRPLTRRLRAQADKIEREGA